VSANLLVILFRSLHPHSSWTRAATFDLCAGSVLAVALGVVRVVIYWVETRELV
jgi:hypothetical protein